MSRLVKDLILPVVLILGTATAFTLAHYAPFQTEYEKCVDEVAFRREYLGNEYTYREVIKWCNRHQDTWESLIKLHNYDIRTEDIHE